MKKKIVALCLVLALALTAIGGATLAYFTDTTDVETNTFTVGDVNIRIDEWMKDKDGEWVDYENQKLSPVAQKDAPFNKMVETVNDGTEDAYIRTFITCPAELYWKLGYGFQHGTGSDGTVAADIMRGNNTIHKLDNWSDIGKTKVNGKDVYIFMCEHYDPIPKGDSILSLTKVWIYDSVKNGEIKGDFEVKVVSEAIQAENLTYEEAMASLNGGKTVLEHAAELFNK